jgi:hypothetical protein
MLMVTRCVQSALLVQKVLQIVPRVWIVLLLRINLLTGKISVVAALKAGLKRRLPRVNALHATMEKWNLVTIV